MILNSETFWMHVNIKLIELILLTLIMSGLIIFGPAEEKAATSGAGLVCRIVVVLEILAVGFL